ncbi:M48 metallopeptidase family protein [Aeromonas caviae]
MSSTIKLKFLVLKIQLVIKAWHCVWWLIRIIPLWGRCSPHGRITLNPHLVKASRECIDYVILHELCYIVHIPVENEHLFRFKMNADSGLRVHRFRTPQSTYSDVR